MNSSEILIYLAIKFKGNWKEIFETIELQKQVEEDPSIKNPIDMDEAVKLLKNIKSSVVTILDPEYPEDLKMVTRPPFVLFYHGDISLLTKEKKLAVVGSRKCSEYGINNTINFVKELCKDFVIVSGLAYGVDATAHRTCIENGGKTIAVLGCGINVCYIKDNLDIYNACKKGHLIISEYPDDTAPDPLYFPIRNRIIAGLSDTLLVTEGKNNSGTKITALLMADKNGNVCCIPTTIDNDSICNTLIKDGAYLVETPLDVYEVAGIVPRRPIFEK